MNEVKQEPVEMKQKVRNFPMPKEINYYMLQNYGYEFYGAKFYSEKLKILQTIMENLKVYGFNFTESEIERRLKNMKSHYRRKKEDIEMGLVQKTDWEYYDVLHSIFTRIAKANEVMAKNLQSKNQNVVEPTSKLPDSQTNDIPEAHTVVKPQIETVKQEKVETNSCADSEDSDEPLDMSIKRRKVLEFNHFKDVVNQLPIHSLPENSADERKATIARIIENLKVVDQARIKVDEERFKLEIRRNDLDKLAYQLSDVLFKLTRS